MDTIERLVKAFKENKMPELRIDDPFGILASDLAEEGKTIEEVFGKDTMVSTKLVEVESKDTRTSMEETMNIEAKISKYAQKKLARIETVKNSKKIRGAVVNTSPDGIHKKVSRNLLLSLRNTHATVVCEVTGVVSILNIPAIPGKVLEFVSPIADYGNCRGIAQEGYDYLNSLDTQILSGVFIVLANEYELIRTTPSATGAENNAILRTASKEKLIQGILLIESYLNTGNCTFIPKLSLIYDSVLKESGIEARFTEWMKLVQSALEEPDTEFYDENALLDKPMKGLKELRREHAKENRLAKVAAKIDPLKKEKTQFRKDMIEAKGLLKGIEASKKLIGFLGNLVNESVFLTVDSFMLSQVISKVEELEGKSAKRLTEILKNDYSALRKANSIDDLEDILYTPSEPKADGDYTLVEQKEATVEEVFTATVTTENVDTSKMPEGLSMVEKILWKKKMLLSNQSGGSQS